MEMPISHVAYRSIRTSYSKGAKKRAQLSETYACPEVQTEGLGAPIRSPQLVVGGFPLHKATQRGARHRQLVVARIMICSATEVLSK